MTTLGKTQNLKENECIASFPLNEIHANRCQACGKCVFGYEGITQLEMTLNDITEKKGHSPDLSLMEELCGLIKTRSLYGTGEEIADAVLAAIETYRGGFEGHIGKKGCEADIYRKFVTHHIPTGRRTDCGDCMDECEEDTVLGKKRLVHVIDQDEYTQCSACMSVCEGDAMVKAGAVRPECSHKLVPCRR